MKSYSQFGEDLILLDFFNKTKLNKGFFFEFGAWDGIYLSNCRLFYEQGWNGCFVESDEKKFADLKKNYHNEIILPDKVDGLLILGGATNPFLSDEFNQINLNGSVERLVESITLIKKYTEAKIIFSGGSGSIKKPKMDHARIAKQFFMQIGLDTDKMIFENKSRNTYENVLYSKNIAKPKKNEKWIVITSAFHMNRAIFIGEKNDWTLIPYAVDFTQPKKFKFKPNLSLLNNLNQMQRGSHEWIGLMAYYLMGRTSRIL